VSYLAIARKYRPATFDQIVGQEHVTRTLENAIRKGRIHHAFLFCGARGVGKTTAARAFARALNCEKGPTPTPCGECTPCMEVLSGVSPDLIEIDGASNNSVDDIRELRETVSYAPTHGRYKIYLIDEVHMLTKQAFNAMLKTLEEPPPHVVFLFATTEPNKILDTILSRVQRFDFKRIPVPAVAAHLRTIAEKEGCEISDAALRMIARAGEGSMRDAQSLLDKVISFSETKVSDEEVAETLGLIDRKLLYNMLTGLVGGEPQACLEAIEAVYGYGYELSQFTEELLEVIRNATLLAMSPRAGKFVDISDDERDQIAETIKDVSPDALARLFHALLDTHDRVSRASRPRIVLEMAVARLCTVREIQPVGELVARLEALQRGGSRPGTGSLRGGKGASRPPRRASTNSSAPVVAIDTPPKPRDDRRPRAEAAPMPASTPVALPIDNIVDPITAIREAIANTTLEECGVETDDTGLIFHAKGALMAARANRDLAQLAPALAALGHDNIEVRDGRPLTPQEELERKALANSALQHVIKTLGGTDVKVRPKPNGDE
jgi:DNA polymerase III subunit gamma/tau